MLGNPRVPRLKPFRRLGCRFCEYAFISGLGVPLGLGVQARASGGSVDWEAKVSELSYESGEEPGFEAAPWKGQAPLDVYLEVLKIAPDSIDAARLMRLHWQTLEKLGEIGHLFLKRVARDFYCRVGPFTIDQWWDRVQGERRYVLLEAQHRRSVEQRKAQFAKPSEHVRPSEDTALTCSEILKAWQGDPPPLWQALKRVRSISSEPNTEEFKCLVQLVKWIAAHHIDSPADLRQVADEVVRAYLAGASSLADVNDICERGLRHAPVAFGEHFGDIVSRGVRNNILLLLDDGEGIAVAKLSKNFRRYGRPDLSVEATEGFHLSQDGGDAVWTSRAAALADLERLDEALAACRAIWAAKPGHAVCTVKSRTLRLQHSNEESHRWALEGWGLNENLYTARTLAASSVLVGDMPHLQAAAAHLEWSDAGISDSDEVDPYVVVKAGWVLLNDGNVEQARDLARRVLKEHGGNRWAGSLLNAANQQILVRRTTS